MGRWENNHFAEDEGFSSKRNYVKIAKYALVAGFVIVAVVVLSVYIPRSGLNIEIIERNEVMGTMHTVSGRVLNNNFDTLNDVSVQFDDQGQIQ
jgi:hypothetical protein